VLQLEVLVVMLLLLQGPAWRSTEVLDTKQ
jgi:hypothetical protein